jgi:4-hydroxythreonine-4-phosphate dehydrogenase
MESSRIRIGITQGDINGIGYEVIIKTLMDPRILESCVPIVYGSPKVAAYHRKALDISNFSFNQINHPSEANPKKANIIDCLDDNARVELGKSTEHAGESSFLSLKRAIGDLKQNFFDVLVTAPINKHNIHGESFEFKGHTEYLAREFETEDVVMLMVTELLKVAVVAGHIPLKEVPGFVTTERILSKLRILNKTLLEDFAITGPKIAVLGLNPHAGDQGLLGKEETEVIAPALKTARDEGIMAIGPFPADGFFGSENFKKFDAVLAMYHDQGLAPFKALMFDQGVNFTAGLPVIRTSPVHGTAYEIAGKNEASPDSFRQAVYLAIDLFKNRAIYKEAANNPLIITEISEGS